MSYKLIALDVDGTLITDDHELTEATRQAVQEIYNKGVIVVLCTGRGPISALPVYEQLGAGGIMITHNGATVIDIVDRRVMNDFRIEFADLRLLVDYCREKGIHYDLCTPFDVYVEHLTEEERAMYARFSQVPTVISNFEHVDETKVKFTLSGLEDQMDQVERDWPSIGCPLRRIRSGIHFIDVINPEATKGNALKQMCHDLGISREEVMAIGNYYNDIEMLEWAGLGIAMANSPEAVKNIADAVTGSNAEDGVAQAIRKYILNPKNE
ncbi:MAG: Cof-type HAD-IIB family hydrolase [Gorillibacterium sp.]|nr:Cof-type HAD-IIB family hydrolase [Gorillibacterium sp.]